MILASNISKPDISNPMSKLRLSGGQSGYTEDEKRVLNHTSKINENIFVPFMDIDLKNRFVFTIPFTDKVNSIRLLIVATN